MNSLRLMGMAALLTVCGSGIVALLPGVDRVLARLPRGERVVAILGLGLVAGTVWLMVVGTAMAVTGLPLRLATLVLALGVPALGCIRGRSLLAPPSPPDAARYPFWAGVALAALVLVLGSLVVWSGAQQPDRAWDSVAIWGTKARALYFAEGLDHPAFTGPTYQYLSQDYPIGVAIVRAFSLMLGVPASHGSIGATLLIPLGCGIALHGLLRASGVGPWAAVAAAALLPTTPLLFQNVAYGLADGLVGCMLVLVAFAMWRWLATGEVGWAGLAAVGAAGLLEVKAEGAALFGCLTLAGALHLLFRPGGPGWRRFAVFVGVVALSYLPWQAFVRLRGLPTSFVGSGRFVPAWRQPGSLIHVLGAAARYAVVPRLYGVTLLCGVVLLAARWLGRAADALFFTVALGLSIMLFAFVVAGFDTERLIRVSLDRNLIQVSALVVAWLGVALTDPAHRSGSPSQEASGRVTASSAG